MPYCRLAAVLGVALVLIPVHGPVSAQDPPQQEQRPVFRAGAHFVRVDAYPTRDGRPLTNLTAADFEIFEDGKPQAIESIDFIEYVGWTPNAARTDPNSQRDAFQLAADPNYRVFVLYLDAFHVSVDGSHRLRAPIAQMLNRMLGPNDLFGLLTPRQRPQVDLILGRQSLAIEEQLSRNWDWGLADQQTTSYDREEAEIAAALGERRGARVVALRRLDKVYADLEELVVLLGNLRDERKNILFFSDSMPAPQVRTSTLTTAPTSRPPTPRIGVSNEGQLTTGPLNSAQPNRRWAEAEETRLNSVDFHFRFRDLLRHARQMNVSFYTIRPGGLGSFNMMSDGVGNLLSLAEETDGLAVASSNDLHAGLKRVAEDLSSHYVLGYYTSNNNWNGSPRRITVKLKKTGETIRARREYRAPTEDEMASIRNARSAADATPAAPAPEAVALDLLTRLRPGARLHVYGTAAGSQLSVVAEIAAHEIEGGRWKQGADVQVMATAKNGESAVGKGRIEPGARGAVIMVPVGNEPGPWDVDVRVRSQSDPPESASVSVVRTPAAALLGDPIANRAASAASSPFRPLAGFQFRRTERIRVDWPILTAAVDSHEARLLDRNGQPAPVPVQVTRSADGRTVSATLNLAPLSNGDYLIEMVAKGGDKVERKLIAIRVSLAR
jgi:VWFA-related protein